MFEWLQTLSDVLVFKILGLDQSSNIGQSLNFFCYDTIKILILLFFITFLMGIINSYFPVDRIRNFLSRRKLFGIEYLLASTFGAITPFCSCSSVPLFIGFVKGGIPLGLTFAFLITSPLVNEVAVAIFLGVFGLKNTLIYVSTGIVLGMVSGLILSKFKLEQYLSEWVQELWKKTAKEQVGVSENKLTLAQRIPYVVNESTGIVRSVLVYVIIGIAIGAAMHGYIPDGFFERYIGKDTWYAVPLAVILGVPMYANAAGIIPVIQVFVSKGIPLGTSFAFMMAVVGLSIPEAILLKKVMSLRLIILFFSVVTLCIIASGYFFNLVLE